MHRRSSDDQQWQEAKKKVDIRDKKQCRFLSILTPYEMAQTEKLCPPKWMLEQIDHAHIVAVGNDVTKVYDVDNIVCLCRWAHTHIDNLIDPLTDRNMDQNKQWYWWTRIRYKKTWDYDIMIDYKDLYENMSHSSDISMKKTVMEWW